MFALHFTLHSKPDTRSITARDRPGIRDTQPDPYGLPVSRSHSRSGVGEFSLGLSPISVGLRYLLHEIGPMTRNPERDTERSQVVRARSPSLFTPYDLNNIRRNVLLGNFTTTTFSHSD